MLQNVFFASTSDYYVATKRRDTIWDVQTG